MQCKTHYTCRHKIWMTHSNLKRSWIYHLWYMMDNSIGYKKVKRQLKWRFRIFLVHSSMSIKSISPENTSSNYIFFKHFFFFGMPFKPNEGNKIQEKIVFRWDRKIIILVAQFLNLPHHPWKGRWKIWEWEKNIEIRCCWSKRKW